MDASYAWAILAALFGIAAGFQGVHQRYNKESFAGATTVPGFLYLSSRAVIPAGLFVILLARETIAGNLWLWSMVIGTSTEAVLRAKFFLKKDETNPEQDVLFGPFDLVKWYQELFLSSIGPRLSARRIKRVERLLHLLTSFDAFSQRTVLRLNGLTDATVRDELIAEITKLRADYACSTAADRDAIFSTTLMYLLDRKLPQQELVALIRDK